MQSSGARGRGRLLVLSGPSGAGKGTLVQALIERKPNLFLSVSATTRPARSGEKNGVHYLFMPASRFLEMVGRGEFLEYADVYGNYYGTPRAPVDRARASGRDVILELDIQGAMAVKRVEPDAVLVFIEPPSLDELSLRLRGRGTEDPDMLSRRLRAAYEEVKRKGSYDHIIVNDEVERAVDELALILERPR